MAMLRKRKVDRPLRRDVHFLGNLLGEVLIEQGGEALFDLEEQVRRLSIRRRRGPKEERPLAGEELSALLQGLPAERAEGIIRAFATYFQLVNLAEQHHRIRRRRAHAAAAGSEAAPQRGSLEAVLRLAKQAGVEAARVREALATLEVTLTLTAHPTQATRRTVLEKLHRIARELEKRDRSALTPWEERESRTLIREQVTALWQTDELRRERPTVADEVKNILWYVENIMWQVTPVLPQVLSEAFEQVYGEPLGPAPSPLRIHSWAGGDMDGNPMVVPEVVEDTIRVHRSRALRLLLREVEELGGKLSQSARYVETPRRLRDALIEDERRMPQVAARIGAATTGEPWRRKLRFVEARLLAALAAVEARRARQEGAIVPPVPLAATGVAPQPVPTGSGAFALAYGRSEEMLADLELLADSLAEAGASHAGERQVRALCERVRAFGFYIVELELRTVAADAAAAAAWIEGSGPWSEGAARLLASLRVVARAQEEGGERACRTLVLSMASSAEELRAALRCARASGIWDPARGCASIDIVPLFETLEALDRAPEILEEVFADPHYRRHVDCRGQQEVMVGYSDSGKEVGYLAASAALRRAQAALVRLSERSGVPIRLFHGRGESVARGGGPAQQAILALPQGSVNGRYKATEQGEALDHKYARPELALRTLELILGGALLHTLGVEERASPEDERRFEAAFDELAELGRASWRALVWDDPLFGELLRCATPLEEIGRLPIGSRPAKRSAGGLEALRAIPWVFCWTQNRSILPGWYGVGSAMERFARREGGEALLREMHRAWPFFRTVIANLEMVLAKTDMGIARRYAALAPREARERLWPRIEEEHRLSRRWVKRLAGVERLLDGNPPLQRSIALRNPYVDPMSFLQVEMLRRKRAGDSRCDRPLLLTISGIAAGMRNTG